jgi:hypothetical protein
VAQDLANLQRRERKQPIPHGRIIELAQARQVLLGHAAALLRQLLIESLDLLAVVIRQHDAVLGDRAQRVGDRGDVGVRLAAASACRTCAGRKWQGLISPFSIRRRMVFADTPRMSATCSIIRSLEKVGWRSRFIGGVSGIGVSQPMQVLARGLARQQADQRRDLLVGLGCAISTLRRLNRLDVLRWCLIDVHLSVLCIDSRAVLEPRY